METMACVVCQRSRRLKYMVSEPLRRFLLLDDAFVRMSEDYIRLSEIVKSGRKIRWICQWCHNSYESAFLGRTKPKRWALPNGVSKSEGVAFYGALLLTKRILKEAARRA